MLAGRARPPGPYHAGHPERVEDGAGREGKGALVCWFLNVGLRGRACAAPPFLGQVRTAPVLSDLRASDSPSPLYLQPHPQHLQVALGDAVQAARGGDPTVADVPLPRRSPILI